MIDFVTVCFDGDAHLLRLQARSMALYLDPGSVGTIWLVMNYATAPGFREYVETVVVPDYRHLSGKVVVLDASHLFTIPDRPMTLRGNWWTQQGIKMMMARLVRSPHYVILDSKDVFIKPVDRSTFIADDGAIFITFASRENVEHQRNSRRYFGLRDQTFRTMQWSRTPFPVPTDIVRDFLAIIETREKTSFVTFLLLKSDHEPMTEFHLFHSFLEQQNLLHLYRNTTPKFVVVERPTNQQYRLTPDDIRDQLREQTVCLLPVHRSCLERLVQDGTYEALVNIWCWYGLIHPDEAEEFLESPFKAFGSSTQP